MRRLHPRLDRGWGKRNYVAIVAIDESEIYGSLNKLQLNLVLVTVILALLGVVLIYIRFARLLSRAFNNLKTDLEYISNYDLTQNPTKDYSYRRDEIGDIYNATLKLKENITSIISGISEHAQNTATSFLCERVEVDAHEVALLYVDGRFEHLLEPGRYFFWRNGRDIEWTPCDLRIRQVDVAGQEILTLDKVSLRQIGRAHV